MEQDVIATRRRLAAIAGELEISAPFVLSEFVARLEHARRRPIVIRPFTQPEASPVFGLWLAMKNADYIYHADGTSAYHQTHIVLHEIAHLILDHKGTQAWQGSARRLTPGVDPELVALILGRSVYRTAEEHDAETLASLILARAAA
jgi:hypothetical protein